MALSLAEQQRAFMAALLPGCSTAAQQGACGQLQGDARADAQMRLEVYRHAYQVRLFEVLRDEFEQCYRLLGHACFWQLSMAYLAAQPPQHALLRLLGAGFAGFVAAQPQLRADVACLAALERRRAEVLHLAASAPCSIEAWHALGESRAIAASFVLADSLVLLQGPYDVVPLWRALEHGKRLPQPKRRRSTVAIWRQGSLVAHRTLSAVERRALVLAQQGASVLQICGPFAGLRAPQAEGYAILRQWFADGWVHKVDRQKGRAG